VWARILLILRPIVQPVKHLSSSDESRISNKHTIQLNLLAISFYPHIKMKRGVLTSAKLPIIPSTFSLNLDSDSKEFNNLMLTQGIERIEPLNVSPRIKRLKPF
jgi:hypothetical protein